MRRIERTDLSTLDPMNVPLPSNGERLVHDSEAIGLALRLRASGARSWITLATQNGKTVRRTIGEASTLPLPSARQIATSHAHFDADAATPPAPYAPDATIAEVMPRYLAWGAQSGWAKSTVKLMEGVARSHIMPVLGARPLRDISRSEAVLWHGDLARRTTSERMALSTLSGLMRYAEDHGLRPPGSNPCRGLRKKARNDRGSHLPPATIRRLWQALDRLQARFADACDAIRLLLLTGARKAEIVGLEWDQIEGARAVLERSKSGPRTIWLNAPARAIIDGRRATAEGPFVFPAPRRSGVRSSIDNAWFAVREAADVPALRLHDLRHHYAAVGVSNGVDLKLVGGLLGHSDIESTLIYAHLATASLVKSASRVSRLIEEAASGRTPPPDCRARSGNARCPRPAPKLTSASMEVRHG